jgi:hypothetical protein
MYASSVFVVPISIVASFTHLGGIGGEISFVLKRMVVVSGVVSIIMHADMFLLIENPV